jgi:hypothetical protein
MRKKIITELSKVYEKEENEVLYLINNIFEVAPYSTKSVKNRIVVDKNNIQLDEQIILDYYKLLINRHCNIKFPNRSYVMTELMNIMPILHKYNSFTIYKFDIKDFFYNINSKISFKYLVNSMNLKTNELIFLKNYTARNGGLIPGVGLHNSLIELTGNSFDFDIRRSFKEGLLFYARYVDDCIIILDEKVPEDRLETTVRKLLKKHFGNSTLINTQKTQYVDSESTNYEIDFLGYVFQKGQSTDLPFKFGIAKKKLNKYTSFINKVVLDYKESNDVDILNLKLELIFKRVVYYGTRKNNEKYRWQVRGISDSYKELKRFMKTNEDYSKISNDTKNFFEKSIKISFGRNQVEIPAKIENQIKNKKFISSFLNNKALLLHQKLGLSHRDLKNKVSIVYKDNIENHSYSDLANLLIAKIK